MKKSRAVEVLAFCMVAISLFSCTSIDKSDLSSVLGENRMAFELLPTSNDAAVTTLMSRFRVFRTATSRLSKQWNKPYIGENVRCNGRVVYSKPTAVF